jgi:hypothetical protein
VRLSEVRGTLHIAGEAVVADREVRPDEPIATPERARAAARADERHEIFLREATSARIARRQDALVLSLETGEVFVRVPPGAGAFRVSTPHADAVVHGTAFSVRPAAATLYRGLVLSAPYADRETGAAQIARHAADELGAALVLGYRYRNQSDRRWMAIDRGTEAVYDAQGNRGPYQPTPEAQRVYRERLDFVCRAAGVARGPAPMIVSFRNHSETVGGAPLRVIEVSANGVPAQVLVLMREGYRRLLDELAPSERFEMRFDALDPTYEYAGSTRTFMFTESDAKQHGYMEPQNARRAVCFFFPTSSLLSEEDARVYGRICSELIRIAWTGR